MSLHILFNVDLITADVHLFFKVIDVNGTNFAGSVDETRRGSFLPAACTKTAVEIYSTNEGPKPTMTHTKSTNASHMRAVSSLNSNEQTGGL